MLNNIIRNQLWISTVHHITNMLSVDFHINHKWLVSSSGKSADKMLILCFMSCEAKRQQTVTDTADERYRGSYNILPKRLIKTPAKLVMAFLPSS